MARKNGFGMNTRTTKRLVTLPKPFRFASMDIEQPAGTYAIDIEEEQLDLISHLGWRQTAATLRIKINGVIEYIPVAPQDLRAALLRDGGILIPSEPVPS